ncbi:hypothetical protein M569_10794, partial [Genlisea aurea]
LTADILSSKLVGDYSFCIRNPQAEWNKAFDYSSDFSFVTECLATTQDLAQRLCTAAEVQIYFKFLKDGARILSPNRNCNSSKWVAGCEAGWACSTDSQEQVDLQNSENAPARTLQCASCCEGFFCPYGITCMMPCPLGSYCPVAKEDTSTGRCV